jgi:hypothetical protein
VRRTAAIPLCLSLGACTFTPAVESNLRMPGEPSTIARELTPAERQEAVDAMASAQPPGFRAQPLEPAGANGRWRDVREVVIAAVKSCEVAMVVERPVPGGLAFDLRAIDDERGTMRVMGGEKEGVTGVQVEMGPFGDDRALADRIARAFERELRAYARIPRPQ